MAQLVLLVLAAVWLAVLIPPMLRSRVQNRPNSSVTDFRRQLTELQNTATPPRGSVRAIGRPLAQSPSNRAAAARAARPVMRSGVTRRPTPSEIALGSTATLTTPPRPTDQSGGVPRMRSHGDPTGGQRRPAVRPHEQSEQPHRHEHTARRDTGSSGEQRHRVHGDPSGGQGRPTSDSKTIAKRRRTNILFALVVTNACMLFLAATTASDVMLYLFAGAFVALCGYVYLLAQINQRDAGGAGAGRREWAGNR